MVKLKNVKDNTQREVFVFQEKNSDIVHCHDCVEKMIPGWDEWLIKFADYRTVYKCYTCGLEFTGIKDIAKRIKASLKNN
ncbi:MAG: hypothetical protein ABSF55_03080 [Candidatus Staskawiczbacteria bacterium]|jgi:ribosomal protein L34E